MLGATCLRAVFSGEIRDRLQAPKTEVNLEQVFSTPGELTYTAQQVDPNSAGIKLLEQVGATLKKHANLRLEMTAELFQQVMAEPGANLNASDIWEIRFKAVKDYLAKQWQVSPERIKPIRVFRRSQQDLTPTIELKLTLDPAYNLMGSDLR